MARRPAERDRSSRRPRWSRIRIGVRPAAGVLDRRIEPSAPPRIARSRRSRWRQRGRQRRERGLRVPKDRRRCTETIVAEPAAGGRASALGGRTRHHESRDRNAAGDRLTLEPAAEGGNTGHGAALGSLQDAKPPGSPKHSQPQVAGEINRCGSREAPQRRTRALHGPDAAVRGNRGERRSRPEARPLAGGSETARRAFRCARASARPASARR